MPALPQLPPGLTPIQAGRFGLWLLGKRSHARAMKRTCSVSREPSRSAVGQFGDLTVPWTVHEYPGLYRFIADLLQVSRSTAHGLISGKPLPAKHARRLALICAEREIAFGLLKAEFEALSVEQPKGPLQRRSRGG